ncbi:HNH endonuclease family protein [Agromyces sp. MMS24-K17]|uniref:HNH endonuclease family protein n=1 Tax=Agromyces sp. MMS24-K17 TaxID=3372850 RepID=UPI003754B433
MPPHAPARTRRRARSSFATALLALALLVAWVFVVQPALERAGALPGGGAGGGTATGPAATGPAASTPSLEGIVVADGASAEAYDRDLFGEPWADVDGNGCDTRNDVLIRDLADVAFRADSNGCIVRTGTLVDPYTGTQISFVRGPDTSEAVQIDHLVPLSYAWRHGASEWTADQRVVFANDPANLLAVAGAANQSKSDSGPAEWMPPSSAYACAYIAAFTAVLDRYDLTIAPEDADAVARVAAACPA